MRKMNLLLIRKQRNKGFTLIELMVGMVVGLMVLGTVSALFVPSLRTYRNNDALGQIQENERFAIKTLSSSIDQAGYIGCDSTSPDTLVNVTNMPTQANWVSDLGAPIRIFSPGATVTNSIGSAAVADRKTDSGEVVGDVLTMITSSTSAFIIEGHDPVAQTITFRNNLVNRLNNQVILINDCSSSAMFEVAAGVYDSGTATTTFSYASADTNNCEAASPARVLLGANGSGEPSCTNNNRYAEYTFRQGGNATIMLARSYYVAPSKERDGSNSAINNSLYVVQMDSLGGYSGPVELIAGVDNFRARYGIQTSAGNTVYRAGNNFNGDAGVELDSPADQDETFDNVVSVEVSLMLGSTSDKGERSQSTAQELVFPNSAGVLQNCGIVSSGTTFTSACPSYLRSTVDGVNLRQRYRRVVSRVFNLRNQVL
ncbi:MAG: PilW family protein [Acidiferrobacterales bacterium]|nr:PilW family protein [Acidiferrobacterales bacterium]